MPNFGLNIWNVKKVNRNDFRSFEIGYSNCIKSIYGLNKYESTHFIFNACNLLIFNHLVNFIQCRYCKQIFNEPKGLIYLIPSLKSGNLVTATLERVKKLYGISVFENDLDAIKARIFYIQRNESI